MDNPISWKALADAQGVSQTVVQRCASQENINMQQATAMVKAYVNGKRHGK